MDNREILTRFKSGALPREQAVALLTGALLGPAAPPTAPEPPPARIPAAPPTGGADPGTGDDDRYAITALRVRFPGAPALESFWHDQLDGHGRSGGAPEHSAATGDPAIPGALGSRPWGEEGRQGRFLEGADAFDAGFFGVGAEDAVLLDPQERLLLETAWQTLETAGYAGARLNALTAADGEPRSVGVYVATGPADYALLAAERRAEGGTPGSAAGRGDPVGRLSTLLDLRGPSQRVDAGEASFLTALHLALGALRAGECAAALVGAVDLRLRPARHGAGRTEGVGAVLLRPLAAARAAGDTVHAVVRASATGHAGRGTGQGEQRVARRALATADADPASITLRETRATVTAAVGDAGAATGLAALARAVLQLRYATLLPVRGAAATAWLRRRGDEGREQPRRATVTVRGDGGGVAAVVLEEPTHPGAGPRPLVAAPHEELVLLSAPSPEHLTRTAARLAAGLAPPDGIPGLAPDLAAIARELRLGRAALPCRLAVTARTVSDLAASLAAYAADPGAAYAGDPDGAGEVRAVDLRERAERSPLVAELPETEEYLAALWRGRRLAALARLWLAGVDVTPGDTAEPAPVVPLPPTAMLRRPLWLGGPTTDEPAS